MISLQTLLYGGAVVAVIIGYLYVKSAVQKRLISEKDRQIEKVRAEKAAMKKELNSADKRKKVEQTTTRLNSNDIDKRLSERKEFRDN